VAGVLAPSQPSDHRCPRATRRSRARIRLGQAAPGSTSRPIHLYSRRWATDASREDAGDPLANEIASIATPAQAPRRSHR
jgi:hypothetical protein